MEIRRRKPYVEMSIKELKEDNSKVSVSGIVICRDEKGLILDDKSGQISVLINNDVKEGNYVRVFGTLINFEESIEVQGEILQNLNNIDKRLHQKVIGLLQD